MLGEEILRYEHFVNPVGWGGGGKEAKGSHTILSTVFSIKGIFSFITII